MTTDQTPETCGLTAVDRQFLTFALDLAFDRMVSDDGFTDEDEAALAKLRRLAEAPQPETQDDEPDDTVHACPGRWGGLACRCFDAAAPAVVAQPETQAEPSARVTALHQPMQRGPFTICAHCSGWDGEWRCLGVVTNYPCPTIRALAETSPADVVHVGGGANAEDCPACSGTNPRYPFICPGPAAPAVVAQPGKENDRG